MLVTTGLVPSLHREARVTSSRPAKLGDCTISLITIPFLLFPLPPLGLRTVI